MPRGFLDEPDSAFDILGGRPKTYGDADGEVFNPLEKSIEIIKRVESIQSEIAMLQSDQKEVFDEARDYGLDLDVIRTVLRRRRKTKHELEEHDIAVERLEMKLDEDFDDDERTED